MGPFSLHPFPQSDDSETPRLSMTCELSFDGRTLSLVYRLTGDVTSVKWPVLSGQGAASRKDELWRTTCFEAFVAFADPGTDKGYWELNLSPSGDWNAYAFDGYRAGMHPEAKIVTSRIHAARSAHAVELHASIELGDVLAGTGPRVAGLTAVTELTDGKTLYWALAHPGSKPDFHLRDAFLVRF